MIQPINEVPIDQVIHGDCLDVMRAFPDNCVDSIVCDPPAGIAFMGKDFDSNRGGRDKWIAWLAEIMREALRCLKPGGHAFVWALPRTSHWTAMALEDAGWEIREKHYHLFSTGFPKSHNISKAIDAHLGKEREVIGSFKTKDIRRNVAKDMVEGRGNQGKFAAGTGPTQYMDYEVTAPGSEEAQQYDGWGSATKPAAEEWILCRKPISEKSIAANVLKWGTGGLNIDKCRVGTSADMNPNDFDDTRRKAPKFSGVLNGGKEGQYRSGSGTVPDGRWPANVVFSHSIFCTEEECSEGCAVLALDRQSGVRKSGGGVKVKAGSSAGNGITLNTYKIHTGSDKVEPSEGTASRFFHCFTPDVPFIYAPKSSRTERNTGIPKRIEGALFEEYGDGLEERASGVLDARPSGDFHTRMGDGPTKLAQNTHPTVKSLSLMKHLVSLVTPINGIVLDCFAGSGSTGVAAIAEGYHFILIEREDTPDEPYCSIIRQRIAHALYRRKRGWTIDEEGA